MIECLCITRINPHSEIIKEMSTILNYKCFFEHTKNYEKFIKENPIEDVSFNDFDNITDDYIKRIVFALYYLYINGGIVVDLKVIVNNNIASLNFENFSILCVSSILNASNLFLGILGCKKNDPNVLSVIKLLLKRTNLSINDLYETIMNSTNVLVLNEKKLTNNCVSIVDINDNVLFEHYYDDKLFYKFKKPIQNNDMKDKSKIKIGLTLSVFERINSFFSNGINQNSLYLCELLLNIGFDVYFILNDMHLLNVTDESLKQQLYDTRFKYVKYSKILQSDFNIIITLSFSDSNLYVYNYLKYMNVKLVGYFCGNSYIIESEKILYNQHKDSQGNYDFLINDSPKFDEIWSIPQMSDINMYYWKILHRCNVKNVSFVWSTSSIKLHSIVNSCNESDLLYKCKNNLERKIAIFEPNISIMKWAFPSVLITEDCYRKHKNIKHLYITNINSSKKDINDFNISQFNKIMSTTDLVKDKKCSIESRFNTLEFMTRIADVAVSHQWGNPLNYLYLDLAWLGYPIIHNAELCKDVGYYYDGFNYEQGSDMLNFAINNHDNNLNKYIEKNRTNIDRFLSSNYNLMNEYEKLIYGLFEN
jgi:hypothetical protein